MHKIMCNNENQTKIFASNLAANLKKGDVLVLSGELGAGKTKFVEGILSYFKILVNDLILKRINFFF